MGCVSPTTCDTDTSVGSMVGQRRRRWPSIESVLTHATAVGEAFMHGTAPDAESARRLRGLPIKYSVVRTKCDDTISYQSFKWPVFTARFLSLPPI